MADDTYCFRCGRWHPVDARCREDFHREVEMDGRTVTVLIVFVILASWLFGWWVGHTTPPGSM